MCAIAGIISLPWNEDVISRMEETMRRRGPDGRGVFQQGLCMLLHRRLAIVDPAGGAQPMTLAYGQETYTLVYNGELYNTAEIREELCELGHCFTGHSDTEVLLHAYAQWQENCLSKLNGIFGFGVWEHRRKRLFVARDRMGVKPLFFAKIGSGFVFASEMKTILASGYLSAKIDREGAAQLLLLGPGRIGGSGVFSGIEELLPGEYAFFDNNKLFRKYYWRLRDREHKENFEETAEKVRFLVTDAIKRQMVSDVPLGTFLSGGLDSSLISSVCNHNTTGKLKTFSLDYQNNDRYFVPGKFQPESDNDYIRRMQEYLQAEGFWTILSPEELAEELESATEARDLPGMGDVDFSLLAFCRQIRGKVKMALSGECADEIFGGYPWYRDPMVREAEGFPWAQNTALRTSFMSDPLKYKIDGERFVKEQYEKTLLKCDICEDLCPLERRMRQMMQLNICWFMQTLLDRKDRMSMYCGLEVRVPFCDYRIAEYLYSVPWEYKDYKGTEKGLLRYAMKEYLPREVLYRKKCPYPKTWDPSYRDIMSNRLRTLLQQKSAPIFQLVSPSALEGLLEGEYEWPWYGQLMKKPQTMAYMLQLDYWLRKYSVDICI